MGLLEKISTKIQLIKYCLFYRTLSGRENFALCRTPPPQTFRTDSVPVNKPNWVQFESPRPVRSQWRPQEVACPPEMMWK